MHHFNLLAPKAKPAPRPLIRCQCGKPGRDLCDGCQTSEASSEAFAFLLALADVDAEAESRRRGLWH